MEMFDWIIWNYRDKNFPNVQIYGNQIPLRSVKKRKTFFNVKNSVIEVFTHKWDSLVKAYCVDYYACYLLFIIFENKTCKAYLK